MKNIIKQFTFAIVLAALAVAAAEAQTYTYDDAGRLTEARYSDGSTIRYAYDKNGNLLERVTNVIPSSVEGVAGEEKSRQIEVSPNPTSGGTTISFDLSGEIGVVATIVDMQGNQVALLNIGNEELRRGEVFWDGRNMLGAEMPSGVYHIQLRSDNEAVVASAKIILTR
ncbi:MAG: FlgD immunoglobulin-like domain containing protein [Candidatus Kapaibacterium sp.]